jgi:predicted dehydrogenase
MSSQRTVRVAIINGTGNAGLLHLPSLLDHPDVEIAGVADVGRGRLRAVAEKYGIPAHDGDYVEMIERERPEAVYVTVSPLDRYDIVATVLEMGCHVFVMKPPAVTTEQTRQLAVIARKRGLLTGVVFYRRFAHVVRHGKALCEARGPVHSAAATFYKHALGEGPYARGAIDIMTSDAIHAVDTLRYLCGGEVVRVASDVRRLGAEHHTAYYALVTFSSGATGVLQANWMTGRRMFTVEIHSSGISCFGDLEEGGRIYADDQVAPVEEIASLDASHDTERYRGFGIPELTIPKTGWHREVNRHFIDCLQNNRQPETCFEDAIKTMELADAIYGSQI